MASGRNEHAQISSKLESETQTRARLESEVSHIFSYIHVMSTYCFGKRVFDPVVVKLFERSSILLNQIFLLVKGLITDIFSSYQISSLRSRLEKSDKELERASVGRVEAER